jgi:membrane protease YdiL (CAAX protease family)
LVLQPILIWLSIGVSGVLGRGRGASFSPPADGWGFAGLVVTAFIYQIFFYNAVGEEVGWRGFALPRLQAKTSPLIASLVIGFLWVPWHAPLWGAQGAQILTWNFWVTMFLAIVPSSLITGWLYNRSQGSILVAGIAHAASNTMAKVVLASQVDLRSIGLTSLVFAALLVVMDKMWKKLPADHPAVWGRRVEVVNQMAEVGGQRSEVGSRRSEVGDRMSEVGSQKSEVGKLEARI